MDKLMENLINAKKIMNKVEVGNYTRGQIDATLLTKAPEEITPEMRPQLTGQEYLSKVNESKLPESIKQVMLETPIPQPDLTFGSSLSLDFTNKVAQQMEKLNLKQPTTKVPATPNGSLNEALLKEMKPLIEHIIESTLDRILNERLSKMEAKTQKVNENLQIKVGDSIFVGKILGVKPAKK